MELDGKIWFLGPGGSDEQEYEVSRYTLFYGTTRDRE